MHLTLSMHVYIYTRVYIYTHNIVYINTIIYICTYEHLLCSYVKLRSVLLRHMFGFTSRFVLRHRHLGGFLVGWAPSNVVVRSTLNRCTETAGTLKTAYLHPQNRQIVPISRCSCWWNDVALDAPGTTTYHNLLLRLQSGRAVWLECRTHVPSCRKPPSTDFDTVNQIINVMLHVEQYKYELNTFGPNVYIYIYIFIYLGRINIHLPAHLGFTEVPGFWPMYPYIYCMYLYVSCRLCNTLSFCSN